ncbi:DUF6644 family protein [Steroidobacter cummioxidans]|uniref:DUF6644 family protein n=1 Tax=Steroidobacter cummioxidans TaxID=1803913 RepID=UPI000E323361|nr:DUF6644 family protein [Steroidobacter cummioxidans]
MFLYDFFVWLGETTIGSYLNQSTAAFAATESVHIIALSVVGGAVLITHLAALGLTLKPLAPATIVCNLQPVASIGLVIVTLSGLLLVAAGPFKYYTNPLFPVKLVLLVAALAAHTWLTRRLAHGDGTSGAIRALAFTSLLLWTGVVIAGRWLGLI